VKQTGKADIDAFVEMISILQYKEYGGWAWPLLNPDIREHIKKKFMTDPDRNSDMYATWNRTSDRFYALKAQGAAPDSPAALATAAEFWQMVLEFTGGDFSLLPGLIEFARQKEEWTPDLKERQSAIEAYLGEALEAYLARQGVAVEQFMEE
jgi:hypothetical protein